MAFRAATETFQLYRQMARSKVSETAKVNDVFALQIERVTRGHLIYAAFKLARKLVEEHKWRDAKCKTIMQLALQAFA